jgi:hypothetical protein
MQIDIRDKYVLTAEQYQYIVQEKKKVKAGNNADSEYLPLAGSYPKLSQAITGLIHSMCSY